MIFLSGCAINDCDWAEPILISREDVLTDQTSRDILIHNETGASLCGWVN